MSVETATWLTISSIAVSAIVTLVSIFLAAVLNIAGIVVIAKVTLKSSREQSAAQSTTAR